MEATGQRSAKHPHSSLPVGCQKHPASLRKPNGPPSSFSPSRWPSPNQSEKGERAGAQKPSPIPFTALRADRPNGHRSPHACCWPRKLREGAGKRKTCIKHLLYAWQLSEHKRIATGYHAQGLAHFKGWKFLLPPFLPPLLRTL